MTPSLRHLRRTRRDSMTAAQRALSHSVGLSPTELELARKRFEQIRRQLDSRVRDAAAKRRAMPTPIRLAGNPRAALRLARQKMIRMKQRIEEARRRRAPAFV